MQRKALPAASIHWDRQLPQTNAFLSYVFMLTVDNEGKNINM